MWSDLNKGWKENYFILKSPLCSDTVINKEFVISFLFLLIKDLMFCDHDSVVSVPYLSDNKSTYVSQGLRWND